MKYYISCISIFIFLFVSQSCQKDIVLPESNYYNTLSFPDSSLAHPKAALYQSILDEFIESGGVGTSVMIRDEHGTWLGAGGYADIASNIKMQPGNQLLIASTSKTFTATAIFAYIEDGILSLDDPVNKWIDRSITDNIDNANESTIKHLLGHTSGIRDIYNIDHLMEYMNLDDQDWDDEDMLEMVYGQQAYLEVDEGWYYSNINYVLLGMILEEASGLSLEQVYKQKIFDPLQLKSAYYGEGDNKLPPGLVKGYTDINSNNVLVEAMNFYKKDVGIGGDGGIAITAQDLGMFIDELVIGNIISQQSLDEMMNWFDGGYSTFGKAGYGLYYEDGDHGPSVDHGGGIVGFESGMEYYIDHDVTLIKLFNTDMILTTSEYDGKINKFSIDLKEAIFN